MLMTSINRNDIVSYSENIKLLIASKNFSDPQLSKLNNNPAVINIPYVYPALLSKVATVFMKYVPLGSYIKDSIKYTNCFRGSDAVVNIFFFFFLNLYILLYKLFCCCCCCDFFFLINIQIY